MIFEYQMLYGVRDAEQTRLVSAGNRVRVKCHWASPGLPGT